MGRIGAYRCFQSTIYGEGFLLMLRLLFVFLPLLFKTFLYAGKTDLLVCILGGLEALAPTGKSDPLNYKVLRDPLFRTATRLPSLTVVLVMVVSVVVGLLW